MYFLFAYIFLFIFVKRFMTYVTSFLASIHCLLCYNCCTQDCVVNERLSRFHRSSMHTEAPANRLLDDFLTFIEKLLEEDLMYRIWTRCDWDSITSYFCTQDCMGAHAADTVFDQSFKLDRDAGFSLRPANIHASGEKLPPFHCHSFL